MTSKERTMAAMRGEVPDRVPIQLGITNMFSVLAQDHIGWDVFVDRKVPYWKVVTDDDAASATIRAAAAYLGQDGTAAGCLGMPGLAHLVDLFDGRLETATYVVYDRPDLVELYREKQERRLISNLERLLDTPELDYIQIGQSGMLTLSTPELFRTLCLPTLKKLTKICKEAGVLTELHCCGKERLVIQACYEETDLDSINPLQPPPMGDCDLREVKRAVGHRLCLKGNVGVTDPLLFGGPDDVEADVVRCMESAKAGGRYILFSEEGIGANTPHENVRRYVDAGRYYGSYSAT